MILVTQDAPAAIQVRGRDDQSDVTPGVFVAAPHLLNPPRPSSKSSRAINEPRCGPSLLANPAVLGYCGVESLDIPKPGAVRRQSLWQGPKARRTLAQKGLMR